MKCSISDEGIGIPESELIAIFDKFIQSSKTKTGAGGTGLGLAITKEIIEAHQGKIWAENNAHRGASFTFILPLTQPHGGHMNNEIQQTTVLIIDDDSNNIKILELELEDEGYNILTGSDGEKGWEVLQQNKTHVKVILLDRMMPKMSGMEFMKKLQEDSTVAHIPVIMQTAAAEREQIAQGIEAGVYYYLTKPYEKEVMLSIVRAAIEDYNNLSRLRYEMERYKTKLHIVKESYFEVSTLDDVRYLATFLANFFPDPERSILGISELLLNAVEHGNLGISYHEKSKMVQKNIWEKEVRRQQALPENIGKKVLVHFKRETDNITINIKDEGKGFDWQEYLKISPERATHSHGRGIALSRMMSFDELEYRGCGNEVNCKVYINTNN